MYHKETQTHTPFQFNFVLLLMQLGMKIQERAKTMTLLC